MKKKLIILLSTILIVIGGLAIYTKGFRTFGLTKVEQYNINPGCLAISAACGECYGKVIDNECYIDKNKLSQEQLNEMGFN